MMLLLFFELNLVGASQGHKKRFEMAQIKYARIITCIVEGLYTSYQQLRLLNLYSNFQYKTLEITQVRQLHDIGVIFKGIDPRFRPLQPSSLKGVFESFM